MIQLSKKQFYRIFSIFVFMFIVMKGTCVYAEPDITPPAKPIYQGASSINIKFGDNLEISVQGTDVDISVAKIEIYDAIGQSLYSNNMNKISEGNYSISKTIDSNLVKASEAKIYFVDNSYNQSEELIINLIPKQDDFVINQDLIYNDKQLKYNIFGTIYNFSAANFDEKKLTLTIKDMNNNVVATSNEYGYRYNNISNGDVYVNCTVYKIADMPVGKYNLEITYDSAVVYSGLNDITVTDKMIIKSVFSELDDIGSRKVQAGDRKFYLQLLGNNINKDYIQIILKKGNDIIAESTTNSRYLNINTTEYMSSIFEMQVFAGKEILNNNYYDIEVLSANNTLYDIYTSGIYVSNSPQAYNCKVIQNNKADFELNTINIQEGTYNATICASGDISGEYVQEVICDNEGKIRFSLLNNSNEIITLSNDNSVYINFNIDLTGQGNSYTINATYQEGNNLFVVQLPGDVYWNTQNSILVDQQRLTFSVEFNKNKNISNARVELFNNQLNLNIGTAVLETIDTNNNIIKGYIDLSAVTLTPSTSDTTYELIVVLQDGSQYSTFIDVNEIAPEGLYGEYGNFRYENGKIKVYIYTGIEQMPNFEHNNVFVTIKDAAGVKQDINPLIITSYEYGSVHIETEFIATPEEKVYFGEVTYGIDEATSLPLKSVDGSIFAFGEFYNRTFDVINTFEAYKENMYVGGYFDGNGNYVTNSGFGIANTTATSSVILELYPYGNTTNPLAKTEIELQRQGTTNEYYFNPLDVTPGLYTYVLLCDGKPLYSTWIPEKIGLFEDMPVVNKVYNITGVLESPNVNPLCNYPVELYKKGIVNTKIATVNTNNLGEYVFSNLQKGDYIIKVNGNNQYKSIVQSVKCDGNTTSIIKNLAFNSLFNTNGKMKIVVKDTLGTVINNAKIDIYSIEAEYLNKNQQANTNGEYSISNLKYNNTGSLYYICVNSNSKTKWALATVNATDQIIEVILPAIMTVTGTIKTEDYTPIANMNFWLYDNNKGYWYYTKTDSNGEFSVDVLSDGTYNVKAKSSSNYILQNTTSITKGYENNVNIVGDLGITISGSIDNLQSNVKTLALNLYKDGQYVNTTLANNSGGYNFTVPVGVANYTIEISNIISSSGEWIESNSNAVEVCVDACMVNGYTVSAPIINY